MLWEGFLTQNNFYLKVPTSRVKVREGLSPKQSMLFNKLKNYSTKPHPNSLPEARLIAADHYLSISE